MPNNFKTKQLDAIIMSQVVMLQVYVFNSLKKIPEAILQSFCPEFKVHRFLMFLYEICIILCCYLVLNTTLVYAKP